MRKHLSLFHAILQIYSVEVFYRNNCVTYVILTDVILLLINSVFLILVIEIFFNVYFYAKTMSTRLHLIIYGINVVSVDSVLEGRQNHRIFYQLTIPPDEDEELSLMKFPMNSLRSWRQICSVLLNRQFILWIFSEHHKVCITNRLSWNFINLCFLRGIWSEIEHFLFCNCPCAFNCPLFRNIMISNLNLF